MPRISYDDVNNQADILDGANWLLELGNVPGGGGANLTALNILCSNVNVPGTGNLSFPVVIAGFVRNFRGLRTYVRQMQIQWWETTDMNIHNTLRRWMDYIANPDTNLSQGTSADYTVNASLTLYDQSGNPIDTTQIINLLITDISDINLQNAQSEPVQCNATFVYDRVLYNNSGYGKF